MLYDDEEQLEVRHVVSLAHYTVDIYAGGDPIPEGELFIKRNCIRLTQRGSTIDLADPKPFCFFSENCSEKEDFYHAMLQSQQSCAPTSQNTTLPLKFNTSDLVRLVQQLHASEENLHTRWINALIGRLFLAIYKTQDVERFIWTKITKKIARVPKPALLNGIHVRSIDMGDLPPFITNPRLRDLSVDGDLTIEADVSYKGNFRLEISAIARIELGSRFKAREVTLVLATILKRLDGHVLLRIKAPPSNRMWVTFETTPKMVFSIEPVVSSRQITYGVLIRAIENRIREVVNETLVLPNWDDIPFSSTSSLPLRGGIWEDQGMKKDSLGVSVSDMEKGPPDDDVATNPDAIGTDTGSATLEDTNQAMPTMSSLGSQNSRKANSNLATADEDVGVSSAVDQLPYAKPRNMRSGSFASAATPLVNADPAVFKVDERRNVHDAASSMRTTMSRSPPSSPVAIAASIHDHDSAPYVDKMDIYEHSAGDSVSTEASVPVGGLSTQSLPSSAISSPTKVEHDLAQARHKSNAGSSERRLALNQSLISATTAARKWITSRQAPNPSPADTAEDIDQFLRGDIRSSPSLPADKNKSHAQVESPDIASTHSLKIDLHNTPIGRGQPLPPPGTPLPLPPKPEKRNTWVPATLATLTKRRPTPTKEPTFSSLNDSTDDRLSTAARAQNANSPGHDRVGFVRQSASRKSSSTSSMISFTQTDVKDVPPALPKRRQRLSVTDKSSDRRSDEQILVVAAPDQEVDLLSTPDGIDEPSDDLMTVLGTPEQYDVSLQDASSRGEATND